MPQERNWEEPFEGGFFTEAASVFSEEWLSPNSQAASLG